MSTEKISASKLSEKAHLALGYALAETRGGKYAKRFASTMQAFWFQQEQKPPSARVHKDTLKLWIAEGMKELGDLGLIGFKRSAEGVYEPKTVYLDRLEKAAITLLQ